MRWWVRRRGLAPVTIGAAVIAVLAVVAIAASTPRSPADGIEIGSAAPNIEIIDATSLQLADLVSPPGNAAPAYVPSDLVTVTKWVAQSATDPDRTTNPAVNRLTPRTSFMVDIAIRSQVTKLGSISCVGGRSANPSSDHPGGRGCDLFYNYPSPEGISAGWKAANWLVANQSVLGVKYVIWQGLIWSASSRGGPWTTYYSSAYGCPNPANVTGCHFDHVHVSMY